MSLRNRTHIPLYVERTFSQKLTDTFDFVGLHWRVLLRTLVTVLLPVCLAQGVCLGSYFDMFAMMGEGNSLSAGLMGSVGGLLVLSALGTMLTSAVVYGLMRMAQDRRGDIDQLTMAEMRPELMRGLGRSLMLVGVFVLLAVAVFCLLWLSILTGGFFFLLLYLAALVALLPVLLLWPTYLLGDDGIVTAVPKAFRYGYQTWAGVLAIVVVVGMLVNVVTSLMGVPYYLLAVPKMFFSMDYTDSLAFTSSPWYTVLSYLASVVFLLVNYLGYSILALALGYQYGHAAELFDGMALASDLENFENITSDGEQRTALDDIDEFERL